MRSAESNASPVTPLRSFVVKSPEKVWEPEKVGLSSGRLPLGCRHEGVRR